MFDVVLHGGFMANGLTREEAIQLREKCLEKAAFYMTMLRVCDCWLLIHDKLFGGLVT